MGKMFTCRTPLLSLLCVATAIIIVGTLLLAGRPTGVSTLMREVKVAYTIARYNLGKPSLTPAEQMPVTAAGSAISKPCSPRAANPMFYGCFTANSPYRHTVTSLLKAGAVVHRDSTAINYWNNGNPLTADDINADGDASTTMWIASSSDPSYVVTCPAYGPGVCDAATSVTGSKIHIPKAATPTPDSDHHIFIIDPASAQEVDMWGGFSPSEACQVGTYLAGVLTCSWGGTFPFSGNGLAAVPGSSGIAGGVAYGMTAITAGDILSGHISHALGIIGPCLDDSGRYPASPGRGTDSICARNASRGGDGAEPTLRYGEMLHLKSTVNLNASPYSYYSPYCRVVVKALQEYGGYANDNSNGYGLHLIVVDQANPGWQTIMASMIAGGDASGVSTSASWNSCFNRIKGGDLETVTINQGDGTILGANALLPPITKH